MKDRPTFRGVVLRNATRSPPGQPARVPARGPVRVGREVAGRNGKAVSVITGLPLSASELDRLAADLKKLCGAGGGVRAGVIEIQGDHRDRLLTELRKLGYEARRSGG